MHRASNDYYPSSNINKEDYIYHNSGYNALNTVIFKKFIEFAGYNNKMLIPFFIDHMKVFEADYISIGVKAEKIEKGLKMNFSITIMMREFLID